MLGIAVAVLCLVIFAGYYAVKKRKHSEMKLDLKWMALYAVFICYIVVVIGATMLSRGGYWQNSKIQPLFYSYREAWNSFSGTAWRNIILNILMFVPFGFLLPFLSKKFQAAWKTYLAGLTFTILIECTQLLLKRGIFELDDLMNNTVGAMIGYGCYRIVLFIIQKVRKQKTKWLPVICYQAPAVVTIALFVLIFGAYERQELGNLSSNYLSRQDNIQVEAAVEFSSEQQNRMVYQTYVADESETRQAAEEMFARFGQGIDKQRIDIYQDEAIYYSDGGNSKNMWVRYIGKTYSYTDFEASFGENMKAKTDATEDEVREALKTMGVELLEEAMFEHSAEQWYQFTVDKVVSGEKMYDGTVTCSLTENGVISDLNYNVIEFETYKEFLSISELEAYEKIEQGFFNYYGEIGGSEITVRGVELDYEMDSKGFYQPVYVFAAEVNGEEMRISIPAIQQ